MSEVRALGYLGFGVSDLAAWRTYARDFLGLRPIEWADGAVDLRADDYAFRIRLEPTGADDLAYIGWEVAGPEALESLFDRLAQAGADPQRGTPEEAAARHVEALIRFVDCDGTPSEAFWGMRQRTEEPFLSPLGVRFKTGDQGLGHVILLCRDIARTERWYREVLGFKLSDHIHAQPVPGARLDFTFLRCNGRHHSLALCALPIPRRLQHFMLEVDSVDDVGRAIYRAHDANIHISLTLGRHSNDDMLSVYYQTPSGFDVEYGWGGLEVVDDTWRVKSHDAPSAWGHRFRPPPAPLAAAAAE